jgi:kexin
LNTRSFNGTSAACPHVSGVLALLLERYPDLTWRDCKELLSRTCKVIDGGDQSWSLTQAGRWYSHIFGFGLIDAKALLIAARDFQALGPQRVLQFDVGAESVPSTEIPDYPNVMKIHMGECETIFELEEVVVTLTMQGEHPSEVSISLESGAGTLAPIIIGINFQTPIVGAYTSYPFSIETFRGETSKGIWSLFLRDDVPGFVSSFISCTLTLYGH